MSAYAMSDEAIRKSLAEIDRMQVETRKFAAEQLKLCGEQSKLVAEEAKLTAEAAKLMRERDIMPILAMISGMAVGGALVGGTVALIRTLG